MKFASLSALAAAGALFASSASAQNPVGLCPVQGKICYQVAVPPASAQSGSGNLYMQILALDTYSWVALGTGSQMTGSNIFLIYQNGNGNLTLSARTATGRTQPQTQTDTKLQLLAGSGVSGGIMTANILCTNCQTWSGGSISLSSTSSNWVAAWKEGSPINSQSTSASIQKHSGTDTFTFDLSKAVISADTNPFVGGASSAPGGGTTGGNNNGNNNGNAGSGSSNSGQSGVNLFMVHGIIMMIAFVIMYPIGAILMPLVGKWFVHAGFQMFSFMLMWAGFAIGYMRANQVGSLFKSSHTIIGTVVCFGMIVQPILGVLHHRYFKKNQTRGVISHAHIWYGRVVMVVGIINGGLGLQLSGASNSFVVAYTVLSATLGVAYGIAHGIGKSRRAARERAGQSPKFISSPAPQTSTTSEYRPYRPNNAQYGAEPQYQRSQFR